VKDVGIAVHRNDRDANESFASGRAAGAVVFRSVRRVVASSKKLKSRTKGQFTLVMPITRIHPCRSASPTRLVL